MLHRIYAPRNIKGKSAMIGFMQLMEGSRVYKNEPLLHLTVDNELTPIFAPANCWVKKIFVEMFQPIKDGDLLLLIDLVDDKEFRPDEGEVNPDTELGSQGRRQVERDTLREMVDGKFAAELFEAPAKGEGHGMGRGVREHPLMGRMKEGVPPKMRSNISSNDVAINKTAEDAGASPELQKQLSNQLKNSLGVAATAGMSAPKPKPT